MDYIFLFSPNNSGTTVISQYLASQTGGYIPPGGNHEGLNMDGVVDLVSPRHEMWSGQRTVDWQKIKEMWDTAATTAGKSLFVECSPPSLAYVDELIAAFGRAHKYLFNICNPYQQVASSLFNYSAPPLRRVSIAQMTRVWIKKAQMIDRARETFPDIPFVTYEAFCQDPRVINRALDIPEREVTGITGKHNTRTNVIRNTGPRSISFLSETELDHISTVLSAEDAGPLMARLGYTIERGRIIAEQAHEESFLAFQGLHRRLGWQEMIPRDVQQGRRNFEKQIEVLDGGAEANSPNGPKKGRGANRRALNS